MLTIRRLGNDQYEVRPDSPRGVFIESALHTLDSLPHRIKEAICVLNIVGVGANVSGVGSHPEDWIWWVAAEYCQREDDPMMGLEL
jgi:hypothetical protein